ncbi:hypothetical protein AWB77_05884 [Caballeronia fortuita]|uniref:Uncharacterized protein n=1 Tax=Caballeronia fortuita TaxID=1777138 RepID=A0A158DWD8_9BURK|nr:hypothetical protein [Caballeronia fortuita]SAK98730.1 hypothetical protein AWB77_05884 [Caballeronia fortuita]
MSQPKHPADGETLLDLPDLAATDAARGSNIIVMAEAGLRVWLARKFDVHAALARALFHVDAPASATDTLTRMLADAQPSTIDIA